MSESRKNNFNVDGAHSNEEEHATSYKPIPESDTVVELEYVEANDDFAQLDRTETMETDIQDDNEDNWDSKNITTMLTLYLQNVDKFRNPKVRKKHVWTDIAAEIGKTPDCCDKKFRNLKQTYIRLLKKRSTEGVLNIKWPYFGIFDQIYCVDGEYQPEIQQKILEVSNENVVAKTLLSIKSGTSYATELNENGHNTEPVETKKKVTRKRFADLKKVTMEMRDRQRMVEVKLDRLINIVEESNSIQRERNALFEQFLQKLNQNQ